MERTHFVVLTGHLDDQPLPQLIRTLRVQRKSGRLQVEYPDAPGAFFFEDGQLVDAQLGALRGLEALYAALSLRGAAFNFNPLVRPPDRTIDRQQQKFISDLTDAPRLGALPGVEAVGGESAAGEVIPLPQRNAPLQLGPVAAELIAPLEVRLTAVEAAITSGTRRFQRERLIYTAAISLMFGLLLVLATHTFFSPFFAGSSAPAASRQQAAMPVGTAGATNQSARGATGEGARAALSAEPAREEQRTAAERGSAGARASSGTAGGAEAASAQGQPAKPASVAGAKNARKTEGDGAPRGGYIVQVLMEVKNGRVTKARVMNPRPGAGEYESLALRMARQRRYPETFTGAERLSLRVKR